MITTTEKLITELADVLDNRDTIEMERAVACDAEGKPAFWTRARYHSARSWLFLGCLHHAGDIAQADRDFRSLNPAANAPSMLTIEELDRLIPLNDAAVEVLAQAYVPLSTFRSRHELRLRAERIVGKHRAAAIAVEGRPVEVEAERSYRLPETA